MTPSLFRAVLTERAAQSGVVVDDSELDRLEAYWNLLKRWNRTINLTALPLGNPPPAATVDRLFVEPLAAAFLMPDSSAGWFDVGSGGGSPAIPLKVRKPLKRLLMVESRARKAAFLREAVRELELGGTTVLARRVEELHGGEHEQTADLITIRAVKVEPFTEILARLLKRGGRLLLFSGSSSPVLPPTLFRPVSPAVCPAGVRLYEKAS